MKKNEQGTILLKSLELFKKVDDDTLLKIADKLTLTSIKMGEVLFEKGDTDCALYIIKEGLIKAHVGNHTFATFGPSQYFGEYALLDSTPRSTTATAIQDSELCKLDQKSFFTILDTSPKLAQAMLKALVWRLRDYNILESELTSKNLEIKKQKEALEIQSEELTSLNQTKDKFFAIIAHDLKNPFSTIVNLSELLATDFENFDHQKQHEFVTQIYKYSNKTYNLLENLLQWSTLQTGRQKIHIKTNNLSEIITDNTDLLKGTATAKGIEIIWDRNNDFLANFDFNMINTVIRNLLTNAIKFTPTNGRIILAVTSFADFWKVCVTDTGIGISEENQKKLFRIDTNPSTIGTSEERGTGLGLILCHEFVHKNGGEIGVESKFNEGSTFWFTIPKLGKEGQCE